MPRASCKVLGAAASNSLLLDNGHLEAVATAWPRHLVIGNAMNLSIGPGGGGLCGGRPVHRRSKRALSGPLKLSI